MKPSYEERFSAATKKEMLRGKLRYEQEGKKKSSGRHAKILGGRPKKTPHPPHPPILLPLGRKGYYSAPF